MAAARRQRALPVAPLFFVVLLLGVSAADGGKRTAAPHRADDKAQEGGVNAGVPIRDMQGVAGACARV